LGALPCQTLVYPWGVQTHRGVPQVTAARGGLQPRSTMPEQRPQVTLPSLREQKRAGVPIAAITAYDYPTARLADEAGADLILVGDSLGMVVLGYPSTLPVTMEEMLHHTRAARRGTRRALLLADMPFGSYHVSEEEAVRNALRLVQEGGAEAVKLEGARPELVERLTRAELPVVAHLGLTPQSVNRFGGYKVQARSAAAAEALVADALALESAGAVLLVLEGVPREAAASVTAAVTIPTIGIGAGPECDGQILVFHDAVGWSFQPVPKFVRAYAQAGGTIGDALGAYVRDVRTRVFPSDEESYHLSPDERRVAKRAAAETLLTAKGR
jgi:3-methyl-2-oxobutanoate hydroxymethyltransferase